MSSVSTYTPVTKSGQITYTGLGNGTNFTQLITKLVQVEQGRITTLQTWRQSWTKKQTAFDTLTTELSSLQTTLTGMDTESEFLVKSSVSSDTAKLTATAVGGSDNGSHEIEIGRLATAKAMASQGYATTTEDINTSGSDVTFNYIYKGTTYANTVGANCSLTDLCSIVNNDANNPGVKASIVYDGSQYYMQLRGMDTGEAASLVIASNSTLANFSDADFSLITSNGDAKLKLDGWPTASNAWITRSTNAVTDLLAGVTLNLKSTGTVTVTTTTDTDAIKTNIQTFVDKMNSVRTMLQSLTKVSTTGDKTVGSLLTGNYGLQMIDANLKNICASIGVGFDYTKDTYATLSTLGILTDASEGSATEGLLVIDETKLDAALAADPDAVAALFATKYAGRTSSNDFAISSYISGTTECGTYKLSYTTDAGGKITAATINGHPATFHSNSNLITGMHGYGEAGLVIKAIDTSAGTHTGTASLKEGKVVQLVSALSELTNVNSGPLAVLDDNYQDIVDMIDDKIAYEERRITNYAAQLRRRFALVDSQLSVYDKMQSQLESQIEKLSSD